MLGKVTRRNLMEYQRRDTSHVDINQRPTQEQYDVINIVELAEKPAGTMLSTITDHF